LKSEKNEKYVFSNTGHVAWICKASQFALSVINLSP